MNELVIDLLYNLYEELHGEDFEYDAVDKFYTFIGYNLESEKLLNELGIHNTSQLQRLLKGLAKYK